MIIKHMIRTRTYQSRRSHVKITWFIFLLLSVSLPGCQRPPQEHNSTILTFGTLVNITLWDIPPEQAQKAIKSIETDLRFMHGAYHAWQAGPLGRINMLLETNAAFTANPAVIDLIYQARELSIKSGGLFNPAISQLIAAWGFHQEERPPGPPPAAEVIRQLLAEHPSMEGVSINDLTMQCKQTHCKLDLGAIAKGYALDKIMATLPNMGVHNAIINAGGDLKVIGNHGDRPWRIGIRNPRGEGVIASLNVTDGESVFTSGDYERFFNHAGRRYHHIIDPRTGYPAEGLVSVTVIHTNAATADAASTALFVAGTEKWPEIARAMGIEDVMVIDNQGRTHITPSMKKRVDFIVAPKELLERPLP